MKTAEKFEYFLAFLGSSDMGRISCFTEEVRPQITKQSGWNWPCI